MYPKEVLGFWSQVASRSSQHWLVVGRSRPCTDGPGLLLDVSRTPQHGLPCRKGSKRARGGDRGRSLFVGRFRVSLSVPPGSNRPFPSIFGPCTVCASHTRFDLVPLYHTTTVRDWLVRVVRSISGTLVLFSSPCLFSKHVRRSAVRRTDPSLVFPPIFLFVFRFVSLAPPRSSRSHDVFFFSFSFVRLTLTYAFLLAWRVTAALAGHCARAGRACWLLHRWFPRVTRVVPMTACMLTFGRSPVVRKRSDRRSVASLFHPVHVRWC